jgi:hypothetical protein
MSVAIPIRRGATLTTLLDFFSDSTETTPLNLTGSTLTIVESNFPVDPTLVVLSNSGGNVKLTLANTLTAALILNRNYELTLKQVQPGGDIALHGPFVFVATDS